jgi:hypothetical protein
MTRAVRRRCGGGGSARGIGAYNRQARCQQSAQERGVFDSALRVRVRKSPRDSARASYPKRGARFMPVCGRTSGPPTAIGVSAFTPSRQRAYSGARSSRACFSLPRTLGGALSRLLENSSRRPARIFGPNSALRNLALAQRWLRFRALTATQSLASLAFGQLAPARISAPGSVGRISATC